MGVWGWRESQRDGEGRRETETVRDGDRDGERDEEGETQVGQPQKEEQHLLKGIS